MYDHLVICICVLIIALIPKLQHTSEVTSLHFSRWYLIKTSPAFGILASSFFSSLKPYKHSFVYSIANILSFLYYHLHRENKSLTRSSMTYTLFYHLSSRLHVGISYALKQLDENDSRCFSFSIFLLGFILDIWIMDPQSTFNFRRWASFPNNIILVCIFLV